MGSGSAQHRNHINLFREALGQSPDLIIREMKISNTVPAAILYMDGLVDVQSLHDFVIKPLMSVKFKDLNVVLPSKQNLLELLVEEVLGAGEMEISGNSEELIKHLLSGNAILLLEEKRDCIRIKVAGLEERNVTEPLTQSVVRGPMEAFTENSQTNIALIRRKIKDPNLWLESSSIGNVTQTKVSILYISSIASDKVLNEVRARLKKINIDGILESGYIEEFIQDKTYTPFPTVYNSERPDTIAAGLLEGRVAIVVDGTPFVLLVPGLFIHFFQSSEDYAQRSDISSLIRLMRYLAFCIALFAPSLYIAITTFHQEMLPTSLLINLASQREGVPFPAFIEALLMEVTYEILREAGVRMPRTVGQAVSIVGTLVIGQAAVQAGIISAVMVIIVSITAISSYVMPSGSMSISVRMLRFIFMGLAASFGIFGILIGIFGLIFHLCNLSSFGIPYMSPLAPFIAQDQKDTLFRLPWPRLLTRPLLVNKKNIKRQKQVK
ncbi:spore germination protein [Cohnella sp. WQ 127256]|uniref:spore germination protein n=1 Tax=Cohnella sp. WQ 127256 TaxID=2938790 RepID=UPI0021179FE5|nr:spore germination protein [Cohnella sp. WQ 127256]